MALDEKCLSMWGFSYISKTGLVPALSCPLQHKRTDVSSADYNRLVSIQFHIISLVQYHKKQFLQRALQTVQDNTPCP